jgi:hypothetical protein
MANKGQKGMWTDQETVNNNHKAGHRKSSVTVSMLFIILIRNWLQYSKRVECQRDRELIYNKQVMWTDTWIRMEYV